jgi:hypothetical protein
MPSLTNTKPEHISTGLLSTKPFNAQAIYAETLNYYLDLAKQPGWKNYVWSQIQELNKTDLCSGIKDEFLTKVTNAKGGKN